MELAVQFGITAAPTILAFKGAEVGERIAGYRDKSDLQAVLDNHSS